MSDISVATNREVSSFLIMLSIMFQRYDGLLKDRANALFNQQTAQHLGADPQNQNAHKANLAIVLDQAAAAETTIVNITGTNDIEVVKVLYDALSIAYNQHAALKEAREGQNYRLLVLKNSDTLDYENTSRVERGLAPITLTDMINDLVTIEKQIEASWEQVLERFYSFPVNTELAQ